MKINLFTLHRRCRRQRNERSARVRIVFVCAGDAGGGAGRRAGLLYLSLSIRAAFYGALGLTALSPKTVRELAVCCSRPCCRKESCSVVCTLSLLDETVAVTDHETRLVSVASSWEESAHAVALCGQYLSVCLSLCLCAIFFRCVWYDTRGLQDSDETVYLLQHTYKRFVGRGRLCIEILCDAFEKIFQVDNIFVTLYGLRSLAAWQEHESKTQVISREFFLAHPELHA